MPPHPRLVTPVGQRLPHAASGETEYHLIKGLLFLIQERWTRFFQVEQGGVTRSGGGSRWYGTSGGKAV